MSGQFPLRVSPSGPFEELGEPSLLASLAQFSKFGKGITQEVAITVAGDEVVAVSDPIPNIGAPADGQWFEIDATLALYFNDTSGVTNNRTVTTVCNLELDDGTTQVVPLPGPPARDAVANFEADHPYDWFARARATVPAERTVVRAAIVLSVDDDTVNRAIAMGGDPSPQTIKITRIR
jgi:hypothetical protein